MGYGISILSFRYRYGHPGYRYGIWANDMGDDSIDMVILDMDIGYLVTLPGSRTTTHHHDVDVTFRGGTEGVLKGC
jgi:hypothetical protein